MTAETLRRAASLMRERAEAHEGRVWVWGTCGEHGYPQQVESVGDAALIAETYNGEDWPHPAAEHIASWDPAVALAVADWLDDTADWLDDSYPSKRAVNNALAVARAYLGEG